MQDSKSFTCVYRNRISKFLRNYVEVMVDNYPVKMRAQWDTGSVTTCISQEVVSKLKLKPTGSIIITTPSGSATQQTYTLDLILPDGISFKNLKVIGTQIDALGIELLIGMDVISQGDFAVSNHNGETVFSFRYPSMERTDYVAISKNSKK